MRGYRNNPKANKDAFTDGWLRTGDLGVADNDGGITIVDRLKDLIKVLIISKFLIYCLRN